MRVLFLIIICCGYLTGCTPSFLSAESIEHQKEKILRVGTVYGTATYVIKDSKSDASGFDFEMAKRFAEHLNAELEMYPYESIEDMFADLKAGKIDIIAAGLTNTTSRRKEFLFSPPLYKAKQYVIYKTGKKRPRKLETISGHITIVANSSHAEALAQKKKKIPTLTWTETDDYSSDELLSMVIDEEIKYTIADSTTLAINRRYNPALGIAFSLTKRQNISWALPKKNSDWLMSQLLDFWNKQKRNGTLERLNEKYFGHIQKFDYVDTRAFIKAVKRRLPTYKHLFQRYAGQIDWRKIAATGYQESHWNPSARSPTGVRGLMMLTRPTARQMKVKNRLDPAQSIKGGAKYLNSLVKRIPKSVPDHEKMWFALASYNIGYGHMMDARRLARTRGLNPDAWKDIKQIFPLLHHKKYYRKTRYGFARGNEAVHYVDNIRRYYDTLVWLDTQHGNNLTEDELIEKLEREHPEEEYQSLETTSITDLWQFL